MLVGQQLIFPSTSHNLSLAEEWLNWQGRSHLWMPSEPGCVFDSGWGGVWPAEANCNKDNHFTYHLPTLTYCTAHLRNAASWTVVMGLLERSSSLCKVKLLVRKSCLLLIWNPMKENIILFYFYIIFFTECKGNVLIWMTQMVCSWSFHYKSKLQVLMNNFILTSTLWRHWRRGWGCSWDCCCSGSVWPGWSGFSGRICSACEGCSQRGKCPADESGPGRRRRPSPGLIKHCWSDPEPQIKLASRR